MDTQLYQAAKQLFMQEDYKAAERAFKQVLNAIDEHHEQHNLLLSNYGLSQVLNSDSHGLLLCRDAANGEMIYGEVFLNLAAAELHSNNRQRTIEAIRHGIKIDANNAQLNRACAKLDCRKKCCFSFLPRGHKLNQMFGRLFRKSAPALTVHNLLY